MFLASTANQGQANNQIQCKLKSGRDQSATWKCNNALKLCWIFKRRKNCFDKEKPILLCKKWKELNVDALTQPTIDQAVEQVEQALSAYLTLIGGTRPFTFIFFHFSLLGSPELARCFFLEIGPIFDIFVCKIT